MSGEIEYACALCECQFSVDYANGGRSPVFGHECFCLDCERIMSETRGDQHQCITRLPEEPSCPSCERTRERFREVDFCIIMLQAQLIEIRKVAERARGQHSVRGHRCELRAAIDSICDRADESLANTISASKFYNNAEHAEMDRLRSELERTREIIASRINAAQCNQKWEVLDALKEIQEALKIP